MSPFTTSTALPFVPGMCLILFSFLFVTLVFFLVQRFIFPKETYTRRTYTLRKRRRQRHSCKGGRQAVQALQRTQTLLGRESAECDPGLADVGAYLQVLQQSLYAAQATFGRNASLEGVIQTLVAQDIEQQLAQRAGSATKKGSSSTAQDTVVA